MKFETVKGRTLQVGQRVEVYFNLHKHVFSIRDKETGLVVAHADTVTLYDARFRVSEAGRQRVLHEKRKNVHALIEGNFVGAGAVLEDTSEAPQAYYNPYTVDSFIDRSTGCKLAGAALVHCQDKQAYYVMGVFHQ
jgi:hypothetical protein